VLDFNSLNVFAVLVAALVSTMLGGLWYSPVLFGPAWLAEIGKSADDLGPAGAAIAGSAFSCLVAATAVDLLCAATGTAGLIPGATLGLVLGLGIVAMTMLSDALFSGWSPKLYLIQLGYRATYLVIMGAICGVWRA